MKSTEIKNWSYLLSYSEMTELDDFPELLALAIATPTCLNCRGVRPVNSAGLCAECLAHIKREDGKDYYG